ncbi:competence protein ComEA helix-hairpin-helix repeat protein [Pseudarthrobacter chlorophenolicus A6]|uniref:Competence protein ComEA helix-hairpin-helix repeat protein n=2 Tax=Pseudarthrobacter chlorophenolicus TaxID=85085 RepID=B8H8S8_PSECP|nr:competence protein ComEA helix-hairpin-helix repeat protein [Pseudarthrobacter chlorophenolicus A6]SDQ90621.1 competence protein ComEA [Pseudarthrobacter chlorophenolicus]
MLDDDHARDVDGGGFEYRDAAAGALVAGDPQTAERGGEAPHLTGTGPSLRWRLGLRLAVAVGLLAVTAGVLFWWQTAGGRPEILPLNTVSRESGPAPDAATDSQVTPGAGEGGAGPDHPSTSAADVVVVHVSGAVLAPGVVTLPAGSRVHQAISAAGGAAADADLDLLNLAAAAEDGQKIHIPRQGEQPAAGGAGSLGQGSTAPPGSAGAGARININTAGVEELDALPKVGPVLAQRIVDWRKEHGPFSAVEDLDAVDGVGPKMLEALLPLVTV